MKGHSKLRLPITWPPKENCFGIHFIDIKGLIVIIKDFPIKIFRDIFLNQRVLSLDYRNVATFLNERAS